MSKMAIEINVRIVSMLHAYVENSNQGPLCFALFAFVTISKVNLKRSQSKRTPEIGQSEVIAFQNHTKSYVEWALTQIPPISRAT